MNGLKQMINLVWEDTAFSGVVLLEETDYKFQLTIQTVANGLKEVNLMSVRQVGAENTMMISETSSLILPANYKAFIVYDLLYSMATGNILAIKKAEQVIMSLMKDNKE
jgi:hypothetical protein